MLTTENVDEKLKYYHQEMAYLRKKGAEFAQNYPKLARRLELTSEGSTDPHVERLIESFAFLTARLQKDINQKFPEFTHQILGALYPHLTTPVPSMAIAKFIPDISKIKSTTQIFLLIFIGFLIQRIFHSNWPKTTVAGLQAIDNDCCFILQNHCNPHNRNQNNH